MQKLIDACRKRGIIVDRAILRESDGVDHMFFAWGEAKVFLVNRYRPHAVQREALVDLLQGKMEGVMA